MFERFGPQVRRALERAEVQARALGASSVGPEHLVLGLLEAEGETETLAWLSAHLRGATLPPPVEEPTDRLRHLPLSGAVHDILRAAFRRSVELRAQVVLPGHLLLAILDQAPADALALLTGLGIDVERLRAETLTMLAVASRPVLLEAEEGAALAAAALPDLAELDALEEIPDLTAVTEAPAPAAGLAEIVQGADLAEMLASTQAEPALTLAATSGALAGAAGLGAEGRSTLSDAMAKRRRRTRQPLALAALLAALVLALGGPRAYRATFSPTSNRREVAAPTQTSRNATHGRPLRRARGQPRTKPAPVANAGPGPSAGLPPGLGAAPLSAMRVPPSTTVGSASAGAPKAPVRRIQRPGHATFPIVTVALLNSGSPPPPSVVAPVATPPTITVPPATTTPGPPVVPTRPPAGPPVTTPPAGGAPPGADPTEPRPEVDEHDGGHWDADDADHGDEHVAEHPADHPDGHEGEHGAEQRHGHEGDQGGHGDVAGGSHGSAPVPVAVVPPVDDHTDS